MPELQPRRRTEEFAEQLDLLAAEGDCGAHKEFFSKLRSLDSRRPRRSTETFD
jgi:hypothetical protein